MGVEIDIPMRQFKSLCENCGLRPPTLRWIGDGGYLALSRSYMQKDWCEKCAVEAQLTAAHKSAERIPELEKRLEQLNNDD